MKKVITMIALAAITLGSAYAGGKVDRMKTDTGGKKAKKDTTKTPPVMKFRK
jgi:hypothetical protein